MAACLLPPASRLLSRCGRRLAEVELDLRRLLRPGRDRLEVRLLLESEESRDHVCRELLQHGVVALGRVVEAASRHGDAVLGAFELRLEIAEVLAGAELGVALRNDEEP